MRNTEDVDLIILTDVENALNFFQALPHDRFRPLFPEFERVSKNIIHFGNRAHIYWNYCKTTARLLEKAIDIDLVEKVERLHLT